MNNTFIKSLVGGALLTGSAFAGEVAPEQCSAAGHSNDLTVAYDSQYIFRGINLGNDLVSASVSREWTCDTTGLDLNAGAWYGSVSDEDGNADELDLTVGASKDLGFARANVGYILYHYFDQGPDNAQEVYVGLSKDLACGTTASLTYFWDVEEDNDGYTELALAKSFEVAAKKLDLGVSAGYLAEEGQLSHVTAKLSHTVALSDTATLTPYVAHAWELNDDVDFDSTSSAQGGENEFFAGASLNVSF